jgi:hypothetical protein
LRLLTGIAKSSSCRRGSRLDTRSGASVVIVLTVNRFRAALEDGGGRPDEEVKRLREAAAKTAAVCADCFTPLSPTASVRQRTDDLSEALEQQTATSEVLRVISTSPGELEPVFQTMLANAVRLCEAKIGTLYIREGDGFRTIATQNAPPAYVEARTRELIRPPPDASLGRVLATKQAVHIFDVKTIPSYLEGNPFVVTPVDLGGYRTTLAVPMLKDPHGQRRHRATRRRQTRSPAAPVATRAPRGAMPPRRREA